MIISFCTLQRVVFFRRFFIDERREFVNFLRIDQGFVGLGLLVGIGCFVRFLGLLGDHPVWNVQDCMINLLDLTLESIVLGSRFAPGSVTIPGNNVASAEDKGRHVVGVVNPTPSETDDQDKHEEENRYDVNEPPKMCAVPNNLRYHG